METDPVRTFILSALGPGYEILRVTPMVGGLGAHVWRVDVRGPDGRAEDARATGGRAPDGRTPEGRSPEGRTQCFVLRVLKPDFFAPESAREALAAESAVLRFLEAHQAQLDVECPKLHALELNSDRLGGPAMLASFIEGAVDIAPTDPEGWAETLAAALPQFHRLDWREAKEPLRRIQPRPPLRPPTPPLWLNEAGEEIRRSWNEVLGAAAAGVPAVAYDAPTFLHGDYHPTNMVWNDGRITGVLDWTNSVVGPVGLDLAHCRVNLVCLFGVDIANRFLEAYRAVGLENALDDRLQAHCDAVRCWTDANAYEPWIELGRTDLTEEVLRERLDAYAVDIAKRL